MPHLHRMQGLAARAVPGALLTAWLFAAMPGDARATAYGTNLIVNGAAEAEAPSATGFEVVPVITGWTRTGNLTIVPWSGVGDFPDNADPGPAIRGAGFFAGGPSNASSQMLQSIDVSDLAGAIDAGGVNYSLVGYLGGFATQGDNATLHLTFRDAVAAAVGSTAIGPVTATDRGSSTGLLRRSQAGVVPVGTRSLELRLACARLVGSYNDGYADSLTLVLTSSTVGVGDVALPGLEFSAIVPNPVRDGARFEFRLPQSDRVRLEVMDVHGRSVAVIAEGEFAAGAHATAWRRSDGIPSGVYFARLQVGSQVMRRRFVVLD